MDYLGSLLLVGLTMAGLGAWVPLKSPGARLLVGGVLVTLALFLGDYVAGAPLRYTAFAVAAAAAVGLPVAALRHWKEIDWPGIAIHPVVVLPALFCLVSLASEYRGYNVFAGDAFSNWLVWVREAWWFDTIRDPDMHWRDLAYTQGWPTTLAYPQLFHETFDLGRSLIVIFLWHVALLGLVHDLVVRMMEGTVGLSLAGRRATAWLAVLVLLAAEATWKLLPELLLIEIPQIYLMAGILGLAGLATAESGGRRANGLAIGFLMAGAYILKVTTLAFVPALALIIFLLPAPQPNHGRTATAEVCIRGALMLGPLIAVYVLWNALLPFERAVGCSADPFAVFDVSARADADGASVLSELVGRIGAYVLAFKLPLTLVAASGLVAAFRQRRLAVIAAPLVLYTSVYLVSLYVLYAVCFGDYEREHFSSLQRYLRVPLRMIHLFGPLMLLFLAAPLLSRALRSIERDWWRRAVVPGLAALAIAALTGYQARELMASMRNVVVRDRGGASYAAALRVLADDAMRLRALVADRGLDRPSVALIAQGSTGFEFDYARYWSLKDHRSGHLNWYLMTHGYSWGPAKANIWMAETTPDRLRAHLAAQDIVWPYRVDRWIVGILADLTDDPACARNATRYFLVRTGGTDPAMRCVAKDGISLRDSRK